MLSKTALRLGARVRYDGPGTPNFGPGEYIVKDLMDRRSYFKPDRIGIGPRELGVAFGADLSDVQPLCTAMDLTGDTPRHCHEIGVTESPFGGLVCTHHAEAIASGKPF